MVLSLLSCTARHSGRYLCTAQPRGCLPAEQEQPEPLFQPDRFCAEIGPCHRPFCLHVSHLHHALWRGCYLFHHSAGLTLRPPLHLACVFFFSLFLPFFLLYAGFIPCSSILLDARFGLSSLLLGLLLASSSLVTALTSAQLGKLTLRFSERTLIRTAAILYFISFLMVPSISGIWGLLLPIGLFGVAQGINIASILNMLAGYAKAEYRAAFLSINWVIMRVGQALGPYLLGLVYYYYNIDGTFYFAAGAGALFILVSLTLIRK